MKLVFSLLIALIALQGIDSFKFSQTIVSSKHSSLRAVSDDFSLLEKKLLEREKQSITVKKPEEVKQAAKVQQTKKTAVVQNKVPEVKTVAAPKAKTLTVVAPPVVKQEPVKVVTAVKVQPPQPTTVATPSASVGAGDLFLGVGLGLVPYLLIPLFLFNKVKELVKKPKPLPEVVTPPPKVAPYSKSFGEGAKEGIDELLSGKVTPELELTRKGIKLAASAFAVAGVLTGGVFLLNGDEKETKVEVYF
jgi:hypothetical protein